VTVVSNVASGFMSLRMSSCHFDLRPIAPGGAKWTSMYGRRNSAESLNSLITGGLMKGQRARSNEPSRVWLDALRFVHRKNHRAYMVYCRRRGVDPGAPLAA